MRVFKTYLKVAKSYKVSIIIYLCIFFVLEYIIISNGGIKTGSSFEMEKINVQVVKEENSALIDSFLDYLSNYAEITDVTHRQEQIADALFFRKAEFVIEIPAGFTKKLLEEKQEKLEIQAIEDSYSSLYMENVIDIYMDTFLTYREMMPEWSEGEILKAVAQDLKKEASVKMYQSEGNYADTERLNQSFNLSCYVVLGSLLMGICFVMGAFNQKDVRNRILCGPIKERQHYGILYLGNLLLGFFVYVLLLFVQLFLCKTELLTKAGFYLSLNLFIFTFVGVSLGMLLAHLRMVKGVNAKMAIANTLSLGMCFLGGSFVPQELLGSTVNKAASFTPVYWFIKANDILCSASSYQKSVMNQIYYCYFIQLGFAAAFFALALWMGKQKQVIRVSKHF